MDMDSIFNFISELFLARFLHCKYNILSPLLCTLSNARKNYDGICKVVLTICFPICLNTNYHANYCMHWFACSVLNYKLQEVDIVTLSCRTFVLVNDLAYPHNREILMQRM